MAKHTLIYAVLLALLMFVAIVAAVPIPVAKTQPTARPKTLTFPKREQMGSIPQQKQTPTPVAKPVAKAVPTAKPAAKSVPTVKPAVKSVPMAKPAVKSVPAAKSVPTVKPVTKAVPATQPASMPVPRVKVPTIQKTTIPAAAAPRPKPATPAGKRSESIIDQITSAIPMGYPFPTGVQIDFPPTIQWGSVTLTKWTSPSSSLVNLYMVNATHALNPLSWADNRQITIGTVVAVGVDSLAANEAGIASTAETIVLPPSDPLTSMTGPVGGMAFDLLFGAGQVSSMMMNALGDSSAAALLRMRHADIVTYDARGTGMSCGMSCFRAQHEYETRIELVDHKDKRSVEREIARYSIACVAEIAFDVAQGSVHSDVCMPGSYLPISLQRVAAMPYVGTRYHARDLIAFLDDTNHGAISLLGAGYGTLGVQTIASMIDTTAHPINVMMMDSPFNPLQSAETLAITNFERRQAWLEETAEACANDTVCALDACDGVVAGCDAKDAFLAAAQNAFTGKNWPKRVPMKLHSIEGNTEHVTEFTYELTRVLFERTFAWGMQIGQNSHRGAVARMILAAGLRNDYTDAVKQTISMNIEDPVTREMPSDMLARGEAVLMAPMDIHMGSDFSCRHTPAQRNTLSPARLVSYFYDIFGDERIESPFGALSTVYELPGAAFPGRVNPPFTPDVQNRTRVGMPGFHSYPVVIVAPRTDVRYGSSGLAALQPAYEAGGETYVYTVAGVGDGLTGRTFMEDDSTDPVYGFATTAMLSGLADPAAFSYIASMVYESGMTVMDMLPQYIELTPTAVSTNADALVYTIKRVLASHEFAFKPSWAEGAAGGYACRLGGTARWSATADGVFSFKLTGCTEYANHAITTSTSDSIVYTKNGDDFGGDLVYNVGGISGSF